MLISLVVELAAGVQSREDHFDAADLFLGVHVDRHAAAVVLDLERAVLVHDDIDFVAITGDGFVDAVVDHFMGEVIGAGGIGIHARPPAHGIQTAQYFNVGSCVGRCHQLPLEGGGV